MVFRLSVDPALLLKAQLRSLFLRNVHLFRGDSAKRLPWLIRRLHLGQTPFFYLDAHAHGRRLPLAGELRAVSVLPRFVTLIDDFQVPGRPGFGYDTYRGQAIDLSLLSTYLPTDVRVFVPAHDPQDETGARRGSAIVVRGCPMPRNLSAWRFPFTLFREANVEENARVRSSAVSEEMASQHGCPLLGCLSPADAAFLFAKAKQ